MFVKLVKNLILVSGFTMGNFVFSQDPSADAKKNDSSDWILLSPKVISCSKVVDGEEACAIFIEGEGWVFNSKGEKYSKIASKNKAVLKSASAQDKAVEFNSDTGEIKISNQPLSKVTSEIAELGAKLAACESKLNANEKTLNPEQLKIIEKAIVNSMSKGEASSDSKKGH